MSDKIEYLNLLILFASPTNPRKKFDVGKLQELAASIQERGIINPLVVRLLEPGKYQIVAGERRFRAAKIAGFKNVPCIVKKLDDRAVLELQMVENLQRDDLDPIEEARGFRALLDFKSEGGSTVYTVECIASKIGKTAQYVYGRLKLLSLPDSALKALEEGIIGTKTAELIARIPDKKLKERATKEVIHPKNYDRPLTHRETQALLERNYMRTLEGCDFDPEDPSLHQEGMKCSLCPNRAANSPEAEGLRGDMCLNPVCFEAKSRLSFERWKKKYEEDGKKVLSPAENKKFVQGDHIVPWASNMVVFDEAPQPHLLNPQWTGKKVEPWRKLCAGRGVSVVVARLNDGSALECADREEATAAAKLNGHKIFRLTNKEDREAYAAEHKRNNEKLKKRSFLFLHLLSQIPSRAGSDMQYWLKELLLLVCKNVRHEGAILKTRDLTSSKKLREHIANAQASTLCEIAAQIVFVENVDYHFEIDKEAARLLKSLSINPKKQDTKKR